VTDTRASEHARLGVAPGTVYLVGSGPGDADLVTQRARQLVAAADILLIDKLGTQTLVPLARPDAELVDVGKVAGNHALPQDEINQLLVESARAGKVVVRLKGGDPYVFGRGGEEALACRAAGIPFEVVPAVTSALSGAAAAGIPVTHRDLSRHVTVVTASAGRDGQGDPNYAWLAHSDGTIVLLMGLRRIAHIAEQLVEHGMARSMPVAVISRATTSEQRTVAGSLATIGSLVERAQLPSPAIIVIGEVVALRDELAWFEQRPLFGMRIGVTRARAQASALVERLERLGAQVVETPLIRTEPLPVEELDAAIDGLPGLTTLAFTSRNGVDTFFARLFEPGCAAPLGPHGRRHPAARQAHQPGAARSARRAAHLRHALHPGARRNRRRAAARGPRAAGRRRHRREGLPHRRGGARRRRGRRTHGVRRDHPHE
jgi:uroporphyrinogen III methyltransferase/synthase